MALIVQKYGGTSVGDAEAIGRTAAIVRSRLQETATAEVRTRKQAGSMLGLVKAHPRAALIVAGFTAGGSLAYYTYATYMQQYLVNTSGFTKITRRRHTTGSARRE